MIKKVINFTWYSRIINNAHPIHIYITYNTLSLSRSCRLVPAVDPDQWIKFRGLGPQPGRDQHDRADGGCARLRRPVLGHRSPEEVYARCINREPSGCRCHNCTNINIRNSIINIYALGDGPTRHVHPDLPAQAGRRLLHRRPDQAAPKRTPKTVDYWRDQRGDESLQCVVSFRFDFLNKNLVLFIGPQKSTVFRLGDQETCEKIRIFISDSNNRKLQFGY